MEPKEQIDLEIQHVLRKLEELSPDSNEYAMAATNLKVLCEARSKKPWQLIEPEVLVTVAANIIGILLVLHYEQVNVVSSKAFSMIWRR